MCVRVCMCEGVKDVRKIHRQKVLKKEGDKNRDRGEERKKPTEAKQDSGKIRERYRQDMEHKAF